MINMSIIYLVLHISCPATSDNMSFLNIMFLIINLKNKRDRNIKNSVYRHFNHRYISVYDM